MANENPFIGTIEDIVNDSRLVDGAKGIFEGLELNAPTFSPERRRFLKVAAGAAAGVVVGGCEAVLTAGIIDVENKDAYTLPGKPITEFGNKTFSGWEAYLLGQDLIFGPPLSHTDVGYRDFQNHITRSTRAGIPGVDYEVPNRTPLVASWDGYGYTGTRSDAIAVYKRGERGLSVKATYAHLSAFSKKVDTSIKNWNELHKNTFNKLHVIGYSGSSNTPWPHLHYAIQKMIPSKLSANGIALEWAVGETLDPFKTGITGGRPAYYDGETHMPDILDPFFVKLAETLHAKSLDELGINDEIKRDLSARINDQDPTQMQSYLSHQVFQKHPDKDGRWNYQFLPGSFMYSLALTFVKPKQEFFAMLPFIHPLVVDKYRAVNPGIQL